MNPREIQPVVVEQRIRAQILVPMPMESGAFAACVETERRRYGPVIPRAGTRSD